MKAIMQMTKRNLLLYFRDRSSVFFSIMALLIVVGLYVLFLGDMMVEGFKDLLGEDTRLIMDSWIMAGMIAVASVTTTMGAYGVMVEDRKSKIAKDFACTPVRRSTLAAGYMLSSLSIGVLMCLLNLLLAEVYIVLSGGELLALPALCEAFGIILLAVLCNSALVLFMTTFFKSNNAFATASTIIGTLIGFLTGCYIPIGSLPAAMQWVVKCFPPAHASSLMRQAMMGDALSGALAGAPEAVQSAIRLELGVSFQYGDYLSTPLLSVLIMIGTAIVFYFLSAWQLARKRS